MPLQSKTGLSLSSTFIKAIAILSCAVLSLLIYDNGSNLLNPSTKIIQDKSHSDLNNEDRENLPLSVVDEKDTTIGPNSLRTISAETKDEVSSIMN